MRYYTGEWNEYKRWVKHLFRDVPWYKGLYLWIKFSIK